MKSKRIFGVAAGMSAGAVLTVLSVILIFGMKTGLGGTVLILITMAVSGGIGFLMGKQYHTQKLNEYAYRKGFQEGSLEKTLIIQYRDDCGCARQRMERTIR